MGIHLTLAFLVGSCLALYSRSIPFDDRLGVLAGLLGLATMFIGGFDIIGVPAGAYFILYLGARLGGPLRKVGARNDYSYGLYIYGFPVEQSLAYFGLHHLGYPIYTVVTLVVALGFAWLSWHGIEKHAMALKGWGPGLGWRYWWDRVRGRRSVPPPAETQPDSEAEPAI
jgi:peptidoglycan/LPS O-acetylase OafA/YrhL